MSMTLQVTLALLLQSAMAHSGAELAHAPAVRGIFAHLLLQPQRVEHAAFIVRTASGGFTFVEWPASDDENCVRWSGDYPRGTVAIAHTHPRWLPMPSKIDVRSAAAAHVPIYVITQTRVTKTDGATVTVVIDGESMQTVPRSGT